MDVSLILFGIILFIINRSWVLPTLIILTLSSNYWGVFDLSSLSIFPNPVDAGLLLLIFISVICIFRNRPNITNFKTVIKTIGLFLLFVICSILISISNDPQVLKSIVFTARHILFIPFSLVFIYYTRSLIKEKIIDGLIYINLFICVAILLQIQGVYSILKFNTEEVINSSEGSWYGIYAPITTSFSIFLMLSKYGKKYKPIIRYLTIFLSILIIILAQSRSQLLAAFLGIIFIIINSQYKLITKSLMIAFFCGGSLYLAFTNNSLVQKFEKAESDLTEGTMAYRWELIQFAFEKNKDPMVALFGFGWLKYEYDREGNVDQVALSFETGDTSWSRLFMRYGILGTLLYLIIWFSMMYTSLKYKKKDPLTPLLTYLIISQTLIISFAGSNLAVPQSILIPMMLYCFIINSSLKYQQIKNG